MKVLKLCYPIMGMGITSPNYTSTVSAVAIEDFMFDNSTSGEVAPLATGTVSDFHDTFDLDGTDYTPEVSPDDEGVWDIDANGDIIPLDI
tara:strand:- start:46 stop:315 length:270 start_codon:yes stop_codon:yes gene_type:complete